MATNLVVLQIIPTLTATVDLSSNQTLEKWPLTLPNSWNGWISFSLDVLVSLRKLSLSSKGQCK